MEAVSSPLAPTALPSHRAFGYTHVLYREGDSLGQVLALISLTPVFVMVSYAALLLSRRDLGTAALAAGQLTNECLNYALKRLLRQPRPSHEHAHLDTQPKWGMPSDHSQFVGFAAAYLTLWAATRWRVAPAQRAVAAIALHVGAAAVMYSRVYLGYHTVAQVGVGYGVGLATGAAWYAFVEAAARPAFPALADVALARWLLVRDCGDVEDVLTVEYTATRRAAAAAAATAAAGRPAAGGKRR